MRQEYSIPTVGCRGLAFEPVAQIVETTGAGFPWSRRPGPAPFCEAPWQYSTNPAMADAARGRPLPIQGVAFVPPKSPMPKVRPALLWSATFASDDTMNEPAEFPPSALL